MTPSAARRSTSATSSPKGRLISLPRTDGHDAEGAGVVAADLDGDPGRVVDLALHGEGRRERLGVVHGLVPDLDDRATALARRRAAARRPGARCGCRPPRRRGRPARAMRSRSFWARQPLTMISRSGRASFLRLQVAELAVELVVGVLPDAAGVEHDDVGVVLRGGRHQAVGLEQPGDALGVVLVHLAPVGADGVGPGGHGRKATGPRRGAPSAAPGGRAGRRRRRSPVTGGWPEAAVARRRAVPRRSAA